MSSRHCSHKPFFNRHNLVHCWQHPSDIYQQEILCPKTSKTALNREPQVKGVYLSRARPFFFTADIFNRHCRKNPGVTNNINNGSVWFKYPRKPWQRERELARTIPGPWNWSRYMNSAITHFIIDTCVIPSEMCQHVFCESFSSLVFKFTKTRWPSSHTYGNLYVFVRTCDVVLSTWVIVNSLKWMIMWWLVIRFVTGPTMHVKLRHSSCSTEFHQEMALSST